MTDKQTLAAACKLLDVDVGAVLSYRVYPEHIALVVDKGIAGCPKYIVKLDELPKPKPARKASAPRRAVKRDE